MDTRLVTDYLPSTSLFVASNPNAGIGMMHRLHDVIVALIAADVFVRTFEADPDMDSTILTVRDGLLKAERLMVDLRVLAQGLSISNRWGLT